MMLALTTMTASYASEKNDTTVIINANKVTIIASDSVQTITVKGKKGNDDYFYENTITKKDAKTIRKRVFDTEGSKLNLDLAYGFNIATNVPNGMSFAPFKSREFLIGLRYSYTPAKALQSYSVGLWCNWRKYTLDTDKMFDKDANSVIGLSDYPDNAGDKRSCVSIFSLSVPFLFTQKFGHDSKVKFSLGPVVNFNLYGRLNNEYTVGDYESEISVKGIGYRPVTVDIMGILHYKRVGIYCKYSPMSVLKKCTADGVENPQFRSISIGVFL